MPEARHTMLRWIYSSWVLSICTPAAQHVTPQLLLWQQVDDLELEVCPREERNQGESKVPVETLLK